MNEKRYPKTILATACIPWTESYEFDEDIFRKEVQGLIKRGIKNIYLFGTAGEGYAITDEQFDEIVRAFAEEMKGPDLYPMVGLISLSLPNMINRIRKAYSYGIRDFQFALPSWGALSDEELYSFMHALCDPFPDCRFLHYNLLRSKRFLTIKEYERLAEEIPNFAGVKYVTKDIPDIIEIAGSSCSLRFFLTEIGFGYGNLIGDFGLLLSIATSNIKRAWEYFYASSNSESEKTLKMQQELYMMVKGLMEAAGGGKIDGAYDKMFSKVLIKEFPLRLLPPYKSTTDEAFDRYYSFLKMEYPQWVED
ncbi:MAG TPA: dihydrodipicolinate synthase family protein [Clostridiaceae bacterium]|nr:dihydrodipicolinate synthase family protein [Clostridiaceae bacterium]